MRRDLLLRHDRTVHAKDGGVPLTAEGRRRGGAAKQSPKTASQKPSIPVDTEQAEAGSDGMVDLEAAAMLMTDFQHKAAAAATTNHEAHEGSDIAYSPERSSSNLDSSMGYISGAAALPHMSWDSFMPPSSGSKSHSITSFSSQDTPLAPTSFSTIQPHQTQLAPVMERQSSSNDPLLQSLSSLPLSGSATPSALSPFPSMTGPVSPVNYRRSPGPSQALSTPKAPQILSDDEYQAIAQRIRHEDLHHVLPVTFRLPSMQTMNRYLSTYFNLYHHHLPFLHPGSFRPSNTSIPLLLAVLSIGALYAFENEPAFMLHVGSKVLVNQFLQNKDNFDSRKCPLWTMQSTLLNMSFESWSGDAKGLEWACSIKSLLANMVAGNRYELKVRTDARQGKQPTHPEWVEDESCRRTYYAVYIFFGMLTLTFNHTPAISFNEFDSLELPSSESLWNKSLMEGDAWTECLSASNAPTVREAHDSLFQGEPTRYSAFATRIMINALFLEVWYHKRSFGALQDVVTEYKLRLALETWDKSLELCEPETIVVPLSTPTKGHPLIFNAMAVFRNTRARLEVDLKSVQEAMRYHGCYEVAAAMTAARDGVKRSSEMVKVIQQCFECIEIAALQGINWVAKTSATNWSVEYPLCGLDLMVILSLWLYRLEHDEEPATEDELYMYNKVRNLFDEDAVESYSSKLSSTVARLWGSMLDEVVVWG